jgi:hypothetical protein
MAEYRLPDLSYDYGALEPHISGKIMELHHDKHHATYVEGANNAIEQLDEARHKGDFTRLGAPDADVVLSERVEPVTDFSRVWRDTPISLGDVRPGDFVVVELGERPGMTDRVVVTLRGTGTGS